MSEYIAKGSLSPPHIVLVDDEEILSWCISLELMAQGYEVTSVGSLEEGMHAIRDHQPDLVICDQGLPDGDGLTLLRESEMRERHIPVIMITAFTPPRAEALAAVGAQACLRKPFDLDALTEEVRRALSGQGGLAPCTLL